jgi:hypothetical protein
VNLLIYSFNTIRTLYTTLNKTRKAKQEKEVGGAEVSTRVNWCNIHGAPEGTVFVNVLAILFTKANHHWLSGGLFILVFSLLTKLPVFLCLKTFCYNHKKQKGQTRIQFNEPKLLKPMTHIMTRNLPMCDALREEPDHSLEGES